MSNPNPLVPQGSLLEQQARSKSTFQMAAFIVALHVVVLGGFLFIGCKKEENKAQAPALDSLASPAPIHDTNVVADATALAVSSNSVPVVPGIAPVTNPGAPAVAPSPVAEPPIAPPAAGTTDVKATTSTGGTEHVVQKGEIAAVLAKKNGVSLKQLQEANPGKDLAKLKVGDKLTIPGATAQTTSVASSTAPVSTHESGANTYTVKGGDNLAKIAKKQGTSVKAIREANGLTSNDIKVGQKLKIPHKAGAASKPVPEPAAVDPAASAPVVSPVPVPAGPTVTPGNPVTPTPR